MHTQEEGVVSIQHAGRFLIDGVAHSQDLGMQLAALLVRVRSVVAEAKGRIAHQELCVDEFTQFGRQGEEAVLDGGRRGRDGVVGEDARVPLGRVRRHVRAVGIIAMQHGMVAQLVRAHGAGREGTEGGVVDGVGARQMEDGRDQRRESRRGKERGGS